MECVGARVPPTGELSFFVRVATPPTRHLHRRRRLVYSPPALVARPLPPSSRRIRLFTPNILVTSKRLDGQLIDRETGDDEFKMFRLRVGRMQLFAARGIFFVRNFVAFAHFTSCASSPLLQLIGNSRPPPSKFASSLPHRGRRALSRARATFDRQTGSLAHFARSLQIAVS